MTANKGILKKIAATLISQSLYNTNRVCSVNRSCDATCLGFNGYRRCRVDICLTLTEREACESSPVRRLTEMSANCPRMRRSPGTV